MNKFTKQCVAAFASLAMAGTLCVAGAVVANNVAFATSPTQEAAKPAPWSTEGQKLKGSITIKKYEDKGPNNTSTPLAGAKFKVQRVTKLSTSDTTSTDLTDYKNWEALATKVKSLNDKPDVEGMQFDDKNTQEGETGSDGSKKFDGLAIGLYKVEETQPAPGHSNDVTPFYMTIPEITHEANKPVTYDYNVTARPKNQSLANRITKTLVRTEGNGTEFVGNGDTMTYKISADVLSTSATDRAKWTKSDLQGYTVFDQAPAGAFKKYDQTVVQSANVVYKENSTDKSVPLKDKSTNNISVTTEEIKKGGTGSDANDVVATRIKVAFNETGLASIAKAAAADSKAKVEIEFAFTIADASKSTATSFTNKSGFIPGKSDTSPEPKPEVPTDGGSQVESHYGFLQVNKYDGTFAKDSNDAKSKLADAKFKLFAKKSDADACAMDTKATACNKASKVGEFTTIAGGKFKTPAKVVIDDSTHQFYIVETEAPANYERDHQAHAVTVAASSTLAAPTVVDIANVPTKDNGSWFKLPKTGAAGVVIFALAGVCLVCFGIFVFMRNRKKEEEQQAA
ncbi:SpaH/EbpB family LPXTG-anchored major pilin [Gardnerella vaginalis]|uniref:SpaH/EbpB family LPXTG-anchored major pilin n=1 Tax=Gardnerella vaginalis TaxID=2702 RepID=UPI0007DAD887|nr:SpaH/EbpB family LPXTG-anchored major pilin [Gardnerella vaginalis]